MTGVMYSDIAFRISVNQKCPFISSIDGVVPENWTLFSNSDWDQLTQLINLIDINFFVELSNFNESFLFYRWKPNLNW